MKKKLITLLAVLTLCVVAILAMTLSADAAAEPAVASAAAPAAASPVATGKIVTVGGKRYYQENGKNTYKGMFLYTDGYYYYAKTTGELAVSATVNCTKSSCDLPTGNYRFDSNGRLANGIFSSNATWRYYENGKGTEKGLFKHGGSYYYAKEGGWLVTDAIFMAAKTSCELPKGVNYRFDAFGRLWQGFYGFDDGTIRYYVNGKAYKSGLTKIEAFDALAGRLISAYYYISHSGIVITNQTVYVKKSNCDLPVNVNYKFDEKGRAYNGVYTVNGKLRYYENGKATNAGLVLIFGDDPLHPDLYYAAGSGYIKTGQVVYAQKTSCGLPINENYYFDVDGKAYQGLRRNNKGELIYFVNGRGSNAGLFLHTDGCYYFAAGVGKLIVDNPKYYAYKTICDLPVGNYMFDQKGRVVGKGAWTCEHMHKPVSSPAPTCTEGGVAIYTCKWCGDISHEEVLPATGHSYEGVITSATCTEDGKTVYSCAACGASYEVAIPAPGHDCESVEIPATCTEMGQIIHTCLVCGDVQKEYTSRLNHKYVFEVVTLEPTCTENGKKVMRCECGADSGVIRQIEALGHDYEMREIPPTCTEAGERSYTCLRCGKVVTGQLAATGHNYRTQTDAPSCEESGMAYHTCLTCGYECEELLYELGHDYKNYVCTRCGDCCRYMDLIFEKTADRKAYRVIDYVGNASVVEIPATYQGLPVTVIAREAFSECKTIQDAVLPSCVVYIEEAAFYNCENLVSVTIPENLVSIGKEAFYGCTALTKVVLQSVETWFKIRFDSFNLTSNPLYYAKRMYLGEAELYDLVIPAFVTTVSDDYIMSCESFRTVSFAKGSAVTRIDKYAFGECLNLKSIEIPPSVVEISDSAFYKCTALEKVMISDIEAWCNIDFSLASGRPDSNPLYHAGNLYLNGVNVVDITIPATVKTIKKAAFVCASFESVTILSDVNQVGIVVGPREIGHYAFAYCTSLRKVTIGANVSTITESAFRHSYAFEVVFESGSQLREIEDYAFYGATVLIKIPRSVRSIGKNVFMDGGFDVSFERVSGWRLVSETKTIILSAEELSDYAKASSVFYEYPDYRWENDEYWM